MEVEASNGLRTVDVQLAGYAVQVGQVQLDTADRHHAGQEEVHVPKLIPGDLQGGGTPGLAGCRMKRPGPGPTVHRPYLAVHGHGRLVLLRLPPAKQAQVILVLQLGLGEAGFPGPVGIALHHLHQRDQPGCGTDYHF